MLSLLQGRAGQARVGQGSRQGRAGQGRAGRGGAGQGRGQGIPPSTARALMALMRVSCFTTPPWSAILTIISLKPSASRIRCLFSWQKAKLPAVCRALLFTSSAPPRISSCTCGQSICCCQVHTAMQCHYAAGMQVVIVMSIHSGYALVSWCCCPGQRELVPGSHGGCVMITWCWYPITW